MARRPLYFLIATACLASVAFACPNCKDSVANTDADTATQVGSAFNYSIFAMLAGVFATGAFVTRTLYKAFQSPSARPPAGT